jgi:hypothetical protein
MCILSDMLGSRYIIVYNLVDLVFFLLEFICIFFLLHLFVAFE